ncbi:hypothetical protein SAMN05444156_1415 [Verrucomicrobium sp. GAS474]|uniref:hypothetical protein n=1 Tax=Verrucomicrobium sp. GAS474 TaxID=1882831 RepID=UPI00087957E0|nr:hypothetical protein [Verrucomicrobium sp. GAS474]SDU00893.1 hypothetical protein SAMN05444156_1415 [Verrucomicrobium sp. GAS474]
MEKQPINVTEVWVNGWRERDSLFVYEQRLDFRPPSGGLKIPPSLDLPFGLVVGFNPPPFPVDQWEEGSGSWQLCPAKWTHRRMPSFLSQIRQAFKGQAKPNVVKTLSIVNLHAVCGEFEASLPQLNAVSAAKLGEVTARLSRNLPSKKPSWIWCAWSGRSDAALRDGALAILKKKYPDAFNFGFDQDVWTREAFQIPRGDRSVWNDRLW